MLEQFIEERCSRCVQIQNVVNLLVKKIQKLLFAIPLRFPSKLVSIDWNEVSATTSQIIKTLNYL
jgi:hypothetical protein